MQNEKYRNTFAISQSAIKDFRKMAPWLWKYIWIDGNKDETKNEEVFLDGSILDTIVFNESEFNKYYYVTDTTLPALSIRRIIDDLYKEIKEHNEFQKGLPESSILIYNLINLKSNIVKVAKKLSLYDSYKPETIITNVIEKGQSYLNLLCSEIGSRKIITNFQYNEANELKNILYNDKDTSKYFISTKDIEILTQLELFDEYCVGENSYIPIKGALDIVSIDHKNKTAEVVDMKRSYSAHSFIHSIREFGYGDQLSFYNNLIVQFINKEYKGYSLLEPKNVVIDPKKTPYVYEYKFDDLDILRYGANGNKGWHHILSDIKWHMDNNLWQKPRELYIRGKIIVNL